MSRLRESLRRADCAEFKTRFNENKEGIRCNTQASKYAQHLATHRHVFGNIQHSMQILQFQKKTFHLNNFEKFYIYNEASTFSLKHLYKTKVLISIWNTTNLCIFIQFGTLLIRDTISPILQRDFVESLEYARLLMHILHISPLYTFGWPEDVPQWPKHVVVRILDRIQKSCVLTYPHRLINCL